MTTNLRIRAMIHDFMVNRVESEVVIGVRSEQEGMGGTWLETRPSALVTESVDLNSGRPAVTGVASGGAIDLDGQRL
ncbi:hypothetical protein E3N88_22897 [Mikania micrantha]|uniref:Uncharacterized protein n=1 Tax=Mikania micrantha TaxID=192012 RepID=A0A5N6NBR1_9ASTR|nr:hypothetical protein E3N88_22897 [Mikania micrantha]